MTNKQIEALDEWVSILQEQQATGKYNNGIGHDTIHTIKQDIPEWEKVVKYLQEKSGVPLLESYNYIQQSMNNIMQICQPIQ